MPVEFLGDWIEIRFVLGNNEWKASIRKDTIVNFAQLKDNKTVVETIYGGKYDIPMPYEEFKANMHINLNPSYEQRKNEVLDFFKK